MTWREKLDTEMLVNEPNPEPPPEPRPHVMQALAEATYEEIRSEYKRRIAKLRKSYSGGGRWSKHVPGAKKGCRCGRCIANRKRRKPGEAA